MPNKFNVSRPHFQTGYFSTSWGWRSHYGRALKSNVQFHMLWLDGVYENVEHPQRKSYLRL